jgi:peroxisomal 3,2-trans-enoyl-CoA isomerase
VGGGAVWFQGAADLVFAVEGAYMMVPFSSLGLVPENGSAPLFAQSMGVHRANEFLMSGKKVSVEDFQKHGFVNRIFPKENFHQAVETYLQEQLEVNDGKSMMEAKRLMNAPLRAGRILAVYDSVDALAERFVSGAPAARFAKKKAELEGEFGDCAFEICGY